MRNHDGCSTTSELSHCPKNESLGDVVEGARGLVEDDDLGVLVEGPGDSDPLALAAADPDAPLADDRVVAVGELGTDEGVDGGRSGRLLDGLHVDLLVRQSESDVPGDGVVGEEDGLRDVSQVPLPAPEVVVREGSAIDFNDASVRAKEPEDEIREGAFP